MGSTPTRPMTSVAQSRFSGWQWMDCTVRVIGSNWARIHWREVLDAARAGEDSIIEHYGKPTAVVLPFADWEALQEELERAARARPWPGGL